MISAACYPYPVNDKSAQRGVLHPRIYSPSESHHSPGNAMYPHFHASGSPSPNYIYSGYGQYHAKDSWLTVAPSSWSTLYPLPPRSSSLPEDAINPKVSVFPPRPALVSDINTPSSISSHSVLTPSSPFAQHDVDEADFQPMDFEEFDCDDGEDYIDDSDFVDEMEGVDDTPSPLYGVSAPQVVKSASALRGALDDVSSWSHDAEMDTLAPADRRLSASVPGYNASHRSSAASHQRWPERAHSPLPLTSSPHVSDASYPSRHPYTQHDYASSSTSPLAPTSPSMYNHISSSSSLAGAFSSSVSLSRASRHPPNILPILQPQPIRPIPPIPLADLTSIANESTPTEFPAYALRRTLSPLPLLCQPVSDVVRYQLKELPTTGPSALDDTTCHDGEENTPESVCEDLIAASESDRFAQQGLPFCQRYQAAADGACSIKEKMYSCERMGFPIRWL